MVRLLILLALLWTYLGVLQVMDWLASVLKWLEEWEEWADNQ